MARKTEELQLGIYWDGVGHLLSALCRFELLMKPPHRCGSFSEIEQKIINLLPELVLEHKRQSVKTMQSKIERTDIEILTFAYKALSKGASAERVFNRLKEIYKNRLSESQIKKLILTPEKIKVRRGGSAGGPRETALEMYSKVILNQGRTSMRKRVDSEAAKTELSIEKLYELEKVHFRELIKSRVESSLTSEVEICEDHLKHLQKRWPVNQGIG